MLFNSIQFLIFFPIVTLLYFVIPHKVRYLWLLVASYFFYMCWNPTYAILILTSTLITYLSGLVIGKCNTKKSKKCAVALSFILNLGILFFFKYFYFTIDNINYIRGLMNLAEVKTTFDIILPVGISFYTFQALSYTMDVYRKDIEPEKNFFRYALFVSFFPQLVAGPIERSKKLLCQIKEKHSFDYLQAREGLLIMLWGLFLKIVVADRVALLVDEVYNHVYRYSGIQFVIATICFALQIYCDFSSYSLIAKGSAKVMGFRLMDNFHEPYFATSISDFWRRWHISLSSWFRDYLYIPLGGNRKGKARKYFNVLIVFLASGLWHGASWNFVIWGAIHGLYQIFGELTLNLRKLISTLFSIDRDSAQYKWFQRIITFILVCFAWIFFRSKTPESALYIISSIFTNFKAWTIFGGSLLTLGLDSANWTILAICVLILFVVSLISSKGVKASTAVEKMHFYARWPIYLTLIFAIIILGVYGDGYLAKQFIYFQF